MNERSWNVFWRARQTALGPHLLAVREPGYAAELMTINLLRGRVQRVPQRRSRVVVPKVQAGRPGAKGRRGRY